MSKDVELGLTEYRNTRESSDDQSRRSNGYGSEQSKTRPESSTRVVDTGTPKWERTSSFSKPERPHSFDVWRLADALVHRWPWLVIGGLIAAAVTGVFSFLLTNQKVGVQLIRRDLPNAFTSSGNDSFQLRELSQQTLFGMMRSPEVLVRVISKLKTPVSVEELYEATRVFPDRNPDFIHLIVSGQQSKEQLTEMANIYADEVVEYLKEVQAREIGDIKNYLSIKLALVEKELTAANGELIQFSKDSEVLDFDKEVEAYLNQVATVDLNFQTARIDAETLDLKIKSYEQELAKQNPTDERLRAANEELSNLLLSFKEAHPAVVAQRARIASLEKQTGGNTNSASGSFAGNTFANSLYLSILDMRSQKLALTKKMEELGVLRTKVFDKTRRLSEKAVNYTTIKAKRQQLEILRNLYANREREAQLLKENSLGYFRIFAPATTEQVSTRRRILVVGLFSGLGALAGMILAAGVIFLVEITDNRIKTSADLERITKLPFLASLGDLRKMNPSDQVNWAFRTLTLLQGKLSSSSDRSFVCGFISSTHGEGRSTWINLLVSAASQRGLRVLTVATRDSASESDSPPQTSKDPSMLPVGPITTFNTNVLAYPEQVTEQFNDPEAQPVVHIPLPGWVWNLERRKQWQAALERWQQMENLVLLVELPPACQPESILLAENLPQVIWLSSSGMATAEDTTMQLETLRHARCNLVGTVLNREPPSFWRRSFSPWLGKAALIAALVLANAAHGQDVTSTDNSLRAAPATATTNDTKTASAPKARAAWQERLTLGPGDVVDIALFGQPDLSRTNIVIGPDGRLSYLQVMDLPATGLTVDELRRRLDQELGRYYVAARSIVLPVSFRSKRYYVLGKVGQKGVFTLDRPITIVEAVARAKGLDTAFFDRGVVEMADLSRSFLVRKGERINLNLERLFYEGDFSQNLQLEPDDYLYFAATTFNEVYVLGEVFNPGTVNFTKKTTLMAAISARGGFMEKAYRKRVLVVRGSLNRPETFIVDSGAILYARAPDFILEPRDIVYVRARPWSKVEELLDEAAQAFIEASITAAVGAHITPFFHHDKFD